MFSPGDNVVDVGSLVLELRDCQAVSFPLFLELADFKTVGRALLLELVDRRLHLLELALHLGRAGHGVGQLHPGLVLFRQNEINDLVEGAQLGVMCLVTTLEVWMSVYTQSLMLLTLDRGHSSVAPSCNLLSG